MATVKVKYEDVDTELNKQEKEELKKASKRKVVYDEDSPKLSIKELLQFKALNKEERNKETVSIRISPQTLKIAKEYGKGYTSFLSRLLDLAIKDEEMVKKCI